MKNHIKVTTIFLIITTLASITLARSKAEEAADYSEAAWNFLYFGQYAKAEEMFAKVLVLQPNDDKTRVGYAKTLLNSGKHAQALEQLQKVKPNAENKAEVTFLTGIANFNQSAFDQAKVSFEEVAASGGTLSVPAKKYLGSMENAKKRYRANGQFGLMYDSRVVDEDLIPGTDAEDGRAFVSYDVEGRFKRMSFGDVSFKGAIANYFSFEDNHSVADPLRLELSAPITRKLDYKSKKLDSVLLPSLEFIWLDFANSGDRDLLYWAPTFRVFASDEGGAGDTYHFLVRKYFGVFDALEDTSSDIDSLNFKGGWTTPQTFRFIKSGKLQRDIYGEFNLASGSDIRYARTGGSYSYSLPFRGFQAGLLGEAKLTSYFSSETTGGGKRTDWSFAGAAYARRSLKEWLKNPAWLEQDWLQCEFRAGLSTNLSNENSRDYARFVVSSMLMGSWRY